MITPSPRQRIAETPSDVQAWCDLAVQSKASGAYSDSFVAYDRAAAIYPGDATLDGVRRLATSSLVPRWHFPMLRDGPRNDAYAAAIDRQVRPGHNVLEIGTGSGLLAMLCARAGAKHVTTCEMVPQIAAAARRVVKANGLADKIQVVAKQSQAIEIGVDLLEAGDVLVSEIIANDFLSEGVLAAVGDARRRLLNSDAIIIPAAADVRIALVSADDMDRFISAGIYAGLDLRAFDRLKPIVLPVPESCALHPLSESCDVFSFNFMGRALFESHKRTVELHAVRPGRCQGVAQWIRLDLGAGIMFENSPFSVPRSHWEPTLYTFSNTVDLAPGDIVRVHAIHDTSSLLLVPEA